MSVLTRAGEALQREEGLCLLVSGTSQAQRNACGMNVGLSIVLKKTNMEQENGISRGILFLRFTT